MNTQWPPPPNLIIPEVRALGDVLWEALAEGCGVASSHFASDGRQIDDPHLFSYLARDRSLQRLTKRRLAGTGFRVLRLTLGGIKLVSDSCVVRVWKAQYGVGVDGDLHRAVPVPGDSVARREYYRQPGLALGPADSVVPVVRLAAIWDTNSSHGLETIDLACPRIWDDERGAVENPWLVPWCRPRSGQIIGDGTAGTLLPDFHDIRARQSGSGRSASDVSQG